MNLSQEHYNLEDDVLRPLYATYTCVLHHRVLRYMTYYAFGVCAFYLILYLAISVPDVKLIFQYSFPGIANFYCFLNLYNLLFKHRQFYELVDEHFPKFLPTSNGSEQIRRRIEREAKWVKIIINSQMILMAFISSMFLPLGGDQEKLSILAFISRNILGAKKILINILFYPIIIFTIFLTILQQHIMMYLFLHLKFQTCLLNDSLEHMEKRIKEKFSQVLYDRMVYVYLVHVVRHHLFLKRFVRAINDLIYFPSLYNTGTSILFGSSVILFIYQGISPSSNIRAACLLFIIVSTTMLFASFGQFLTNESENIFVTACSLPWYKWNENSKRLFLIMLGNSLVPFSPKVAQVLTIDHRMIILNLKRMYAIVMFIINLGQFRNNV